MSGESDTAQTSDYRSALEFASAAKVVSRALRRGWMLAALVGAGVALPVACALVVADLVFGVGFPTLSAVLLTCTVGCIGAALPLLAAPWLIASALDRLSGDDATARRMRQALKSSPARPPAPELELRARFWVPAALAISRMRHAGSAAIFLGNACVVFALVSLPRAPFESLLIVAGVLSATAALTNVLILVLDSRRLRTWTAAHPSRGAGDVA